MAVFDYAIIAVLLISASLSLLRGFTKEMLSITGWILSGYAAVFIGPSLKPLLADYIDIDWVVSGGAMLIVFLVVLIIASIASSFIAGSIKGTGLVPLDRTLGVGFGLLRGAFIICMFYFGISAVIPEKDHPAFIADAQLRPMVQTGTKAFVAIVPLDRLPLNVANIGQTVTEKGTDALRDAGEKALRDAVQQELKNLSEEVKDSALDRGYKQLERYQMERLIRNTEEAK